MSEWIDNADSFICPKCGFESNNPNKHFKTCPECGFIPVEFERVNRPYHYTSGKFECIDVMLDVFGMKSVEDFCLLNAFKYIWRADRKGELEDIKKAKWYLNKIIELEEGE